MGSTVYLLFTARSSTDKAALEERRMIRKLEEKYRLPTPQDGWQIIENGSCRHLGRPKLFDPQGYSYHLKQQNGTLRSGTVAEGL